MNTSKVSLNNLESIIKAAEAECNILQCNEDSPIIEVSEKPPTSQNIKEVLKNTNIGSVLNQISTNSDEINKMMEESMSKITPDMMDQARKLAMGGQGDQIMKEMQKRGLNPKALKAQMLDQQKTLKALKPKTNETMKQVILITTSRQVRIRKIPDDNIMAGAATLLKYSDPIELSCSRLAQGPLKGKTIKVWYNPEQQGKNRRSSKIVGFPIGGEIVIVMDEGDITEADFIAAEKKLE